MAYAEKIENFGDSNWYLIDRKPYKCPTCNSTKTIAKAVLGYPTEDDWFNENIYCIGCIPSPTPVQCKFGCNECDSKFWKDTPEMRDHIREVKEYWEQQEQQQQ